jgi:hypothetical protein
MQQIRRSAFDFEPPRRAGTRPRRLLTARARCHLLARMRAHAFLALALHAVIGCAASGGSVEASATAGSGGAGGASGSTTGVGGSPSTTSSSGGGSSTTATSTTATTGSGGSGGGAPEPSRIGVFRPADATWTLDDGNGAFDGCGTDTCVLAFGQGTDIPVAGDWTGSGKTLIGIFRPGDTTWTLDDGNRAFDGCGTDTCLPAFGAIGDRPVVGDWTGTGTTAIGAFRPSDATWSLDDGNGTWDGCGVDTCLPTFGTQGDVPVAGDWAGTGTTAIGVFRPSDATWSLDDGDGTWEGCGVDTCLATFGAPGDIPVVGDWTGTGKTSIGVFRPSNLSWVLDTGNGVFDGCGVDLCLDFGAPGDLPVAGRW